MTPSRRVGRRSSPVVAESRTRPHPAAAFATIGRLGYTPARPTAVSRTGSMTQLTPVDLVRILGHVTLILVIPMVGGTVLGLVLDAMLGTSPLLVVGGLVVGSLVAGLGHLALYPAASHDRPARGVRTSSQMADDEEATRLHRPRCRGA